MTKLKHYFSLIKFSHTIFAMPFAMIGFFLGLDVFIDLSELFEYSPVLSGGDDKDYSVVFTWQFWAVKFVLVVLCMVFARSAAMAFNRYLDSHLDAKNPRTAVREIPSGIITKENALVFTVVNCILFVACTFFINAICFYLSPIALFVILFYSYTKRFTALCHMVLGLGLSLAPIGAYLSVTAFFDMLPLMFSFAVLFWVSGFDIIYALQDEEFDKAHSLHSIPSMVGKRKALRISELLHVLSSCCIIYAGVSGKFGYWYWAGVTVFVGMLIYQHAIVKPNDLRRVNVAFMTANGVASVIFAIFVLLDLFLTPTVTII